MTLPLLAALKAAGVRRIALLGTPASWAFLAPRSTGVEILDIDGRDWLGLFGAAPLGTSARKLLREIDGALLCIADHGTAIAGALRQAGLSRIAHAYPARREERMPASAPALEPELWRVDWPPSPHHAASRLFASGAALGLSELTLAPTAPSLPGSDPLLRIEDEEKGQAIRNLGISLPRGGLLALHPGSGGGHKCWPIEGYAALAEASSRSLGITPVFLIGAADAARWDALSRILPRGIPRLVLRNRPLREVLALLSLARAYVGNDSGVTHLAARACPTLALFGPTDPRIWHPLGRQVAVLRAPENDLTGLRIETAMSALAELLDETRD